MLVVDNIDVTIGTKHILEGVSMELKQGEITVLIGHNGAGKSTTLNSILGLIPIKRGKISLNDMELSNKKTTDIVKSGVSLVPQMDNVFRNLTVEENLELGSLTTNDKNRRFTKEEIYELFPILEERKKQYVGTMSGGQRQMVAIGIGLMANPSYLLLDEPSIGLQPNLVDKVLETIKIINEKYGVSILLVEQNITKVMEIAHRVYVLNRGTIIKEFKPGEMASEELWELM